MSINERLGTSDTISFTKTTGATQVVRDGKVAILYTSNYGTGWFTYHGIHELLRDPEVVVLVEKRDMAGAHERDHYNDKIIEYCNNRYGSNYYYGGADLLTIAWLEIGEKFRIVEYDGKEWIELLTETVWMEA